MFSVPSKGASSKGATAKRLLSSGEFNSPKRTLTPGDVGKYVDKVKRGLNSPLEKKSKSFAFARMYFDAKEFNQARKYLEDFLTVQDRDFRVHNLLGETHEVLNNNAQALQAYKRSLELCSTQKEILIKVVELCCKTPIDPLRAKVWADKAHKMCPGHPAVFELKWHLLNLESPKDYEEMELLLADELTRRAHDSSLHVKLVNMYIEADSCEQAFMHCQSVQKTNAFKNDIVWLECSCDTFQLYKNNDHGENKTLASLLFALSLCELMNLHLKSKDTNICQTTLKRLDALLYKLENTNSVEVASAHTLEWKDCVCETKAQLYLSAAVLLMKLADQGVISWMQANRMAVIYLLASWTVDVPASTTKLYARHSPIKKQTHASYHWSVLACTRLSQAGHLLLSLESQFGEEWVQGCLSDFTNPQGQKKLLDTLLTKQESNVKSFLNEDESLYNLQLELPTPEQLVVYDEVTVAEHADNLHLIIWLGLHWNKLSEKIKPGVGVMVGRLYEGISLDVKNMRNCHFSSMCLRDVEGFIYAVIRSSKNIHTECHKDNDELKLLPLPICPSLVSPAQQEWWQAAYTLYTGKVGTLSTPKLKVVLQKGLETIRCQRDHGIDARILMYMAVAFIEKAMEVEMGKKQEYDYQEHWESLQRRAVFYMKEAIKILEIFKRNKTIPMVENPLIPPLSDAILPDEVLSMLNKNYLKLAEACILSNDLHDALKYYDQVNSLQAMYSQAQIYIQLASQSNTETLDGEKDHVYYISKAKEKLTVCIANADHSPEFKQTLVEQLRGLQTLQTSSSGVGGAKKCLDFQRPATPQLLAEDLDVSLGSNVLTSTKAEPSAAVSATTTKSALQQQLEFENESLKHTLALYKAQIDNMAFQQQALMHGYPPIIPPSYMAPTGIISPQGLLTPAGATPMVIPPSVMTTPQQHLATSRQQIVPVSQPLHIQQQASPRVVPQQYVYPQSAMPLQGPPPAAMPMHGPSHPDMQLQGLPPQPLQPQQSSMPPQPIIPPQIVAQSADDSNFQQQPTFNTQNQFNNQIGAPQLEQADYTQSSHSSLVPPRLVSSAVGVRSDSNPVTPTVGLTGESQNSDMWWDSFSPQPTFEKGYFSGLSEHVEQLREESGEGEAPTLKDTVTTTPQAAEAPTDATTSVIELDDIYVEPIVKLGAQCETITGEEGEEEKFVHRAKLYRFDKDGGQWKERGVGDVKILWNNTTKKARITMRRDQVFRVCCNHFITPEMKLEAKVGAKGAWSWFTAADASDDDIRPEQYTIKFKEAEKAEEFRDVFLKWQKESDEQTPAAGVVKEKKAIHIRPLANMLNKPKCDSWACDTCMVLNPPDCTACLACKTAKPNKDVKKTPEKKESTPSTSAVPWFSVKVSESCVQESPEGKPVFAFATTNNQVNPFFAAKTGTSQPVLTSASQSTSNIFANVLTSPEDLSLPGHVHHSQSYPIMTSLLKQQTTPEKAQTIAGMDKLPAFEKGIVESNVDPSSFWQSASPEKIFFTGNTTALESLGHQEECKQDTEEDDASNLDVTPLNNTDYDGDDYYYGDNCYDENGRYYGEGAEYYEGYGDYDPNEDFGDYDDEDEEEGEDEDESGQVSAANSSRRESYEQQFSSVDHANIQVVPDEDIVVYTDDDLSITFEMQPSAEQLTKAAKHQLPATFYLYENCEGCSGCVGCKDDFVEVSKVVERRQPAKEFEVEEQPEQQQRPSVIFGGGRSGAPVNLFAEMASAQQGFSGNTGGGFSGAGEQLFSTANEDNAEEYDPHYEAIVQVNKLATITTGEEDDDVMFKHRAKLYRYDNQWKERGVGDIKLTKNRQTGYCRVIMRRDIIHKLCANHAIMPNMELKLLPSSDKAWVWGTPSDYAEGIPPVPSLFCIKFKNNKVANEFKTVFETLKETMITTLAEMEKDSTADKKVNEQPKKDETPSLMSKFALKADEWECTGCDVRNDKSSAVCVACNSPNPNAPATETKQPANFGQVSSQSTFSFGQKTESPFSFGQKATQESPFTFGVKPQVAQNKQDDTKPTFSFGQKTTTESTTSFAGFKPATNENPFPSKSLFGSSDENKDAKDHSSSYFCAQKETTQDTSKDTSQKPLFSFGKIQSTEATTESQPSFSFGTPQTDKPKADDKPSFSFGTPQGANEPAKPLFSFPPKTTNEVTESPLTSKDSEKPEAKSSQAEEVSSPNHLDEERDIHVEAIASVTKLATISTGEENEETIYSQRLKLYRYDADSKSWKERGIGELKLTKNSQANACRVIMRREQVRKLCANHFLLSDMQLKPLNKSDKAWTWLTQADISDGEPKKEHFCAKFKTVEDATKFKESFEKCQSMLSSAPVATPKYTKPKEEIKAKVDLKSKFAPKEGSWECDVCMIANESSSSKCVACQNPNPNAPVNDETTASTKLGATPFKFGMQSAANESTPSGSFSFGKQANDQSASFTFGVPKADDKQIFSFGAPQTDKPKADDKPTFSFGAPQAANDPAKPLFSFPPKTTNEVKESSLTSRDSEKPEVKSSQAEEVSSPTHLDEERDIHVEAIASVTKLATISTGEENEETIYSQRLKLYRYDADSKSWKERGIGELKLAKNSQMNVCRVIMRREQVRKLCANHLLLSDMQLKPLNKSDKAWTWLTQADISDGEPKKEHFCAKFKTVEDATKFKESFEKCQSMLSSAPVATPKDTKSKEEIKAMVDLKSKFAPKEGSWECDVCMIANESSSSKCVACQNPNPNAPVNDETTASNQLGATPFKFGMQSAANESTPSESFSFGKQENDQSASFTFGVSKADDGPTFSFGAQQTDKPKDDDKPKFSFGTQQNEKPKDETKATFIFGAPQTNKPKADDKPTFSFGTPQGANEPAKPLFSFPPKTTNEVKESSLTSRDSEKPEVKSSQAEEVSSPTHLDEEQDIHVEAIASVTKLATISTGEENEETIYSQRLKLYRYDADSKSWKERGIGELKLTKNSQTNVCRVIMRREQVRKLCANHLLFSDMQLKPLNKSDKAWTWLTQADISDGEPKKEHFCAKFKTVEDATKFKESFEKCQSMLSSAPVATPKDAKPKEETKAKCVACQNPNPNAPVNDEVSAVPQFSFGAQQPASSTGFSFVAPSNASGFSFRASSTSAPMFGSSNTSAAPTFGNTAAPTFVNTSLIVATKSDTTNFSPFTFEAKPATGAPSVLPSNPETSEVPSALEEDPETWQCPMCLAKNKSERKKCRQCEAERQKTPVVRLDPSASKPLQFNPDMFKTPPKNNTTKSPFVTPTKDLMPPPVGLPIGFTTPKQKTSPKQTPLKSSSWMPKGLQNITFSLGLVQSPSLSAASSVEDLSEASKTSQVKSLFGDGSFAFNFDKTATPPKSPTKPSAIKSPQSPTEVEGADCEVEFTPIVSLAHVGQTTGEEKEEVIFCERSKMFRYQQNQWKERGVGEMRILKSKLTGQCRLLLRRDQTFKLCANHMLLKDMTIKPMGTTKNAYIWKTLSDISDGEPVEQTFAAKFKVEERASDFAKVFEEATQGGKEEGQLAEVIEISSDEEEEAVLDSEVEITYEPMISESSKKKARELLLPHAFYHQPSVVIGDRPTKTSAQSSSCADTPGENDRDVVITHVKQVEISPSKDTLLLPKSFYNYLDQEKLFQNAKTVFSDHGYILIGDEEKEGSIDIVVEDSLHHIAVFDQNKTLLWRREITRDVTLSMPQGSKTVFECEDAALKFDDMPSAESFLNFFEERKPQEQQDKVFGAGFSGNTFGGQINGGLTFATLASEENSGFQSNAGKNFSGKGAALFDTEETVEKQGEIYVEPIVQLSSVKVTSGEDEEAVVFFERCKLYRFDDKKWKERGVGELKLLQHRTSAKARLVMRRDQTHKLCANHYLSDVMKLEPFKNNDRTLMWSAFSDVSDTTPLDTVFAARFKNDELVSSFRSHFTSLCNGERLDEIAVRQSSPPPDAPAVLGTCDPHIAL